MLNTDNLMLQVAKDGIKSMLEENVDIVCNKTTKEVDLLFTIGDFCSKFAIWKFQTPQSSVKKQKIRLELFAAVPFLRWKILPTAYHDNTLILAAS